MRARVQIAVAARLRRAALLAVAGLALFAAMPAHASTAGLEPYSEPPDTPPEESCSRYAMCPRFRLVIRAAPGEANDFDLVPEGDAILVRDVAITAGASCSATPEGGVRCPRPDGGIEVLAGDGPDRVQAPTVAALYRGGPGDDLIIAAGVLVGEEGADVLWASTASTLLAGGPGDDRLVGPAGFPDCGRGRDVLEPRRAATLTARHHGCERIAAPEAGFELAIAPLLLRHGRVLLRLRGTRTVPTTVDVTVRAAGSRRPLGSGRFRVGPNGVVQALPLRGVRGRRVIVTARAPGPPGTVSFAGVLRRG
jgi:hypothetical protein